MYEHNTMAYSHILAILTIGIPLIFGQDCKAPLIPENGFLTKGYRGGSDHIKYSCVEGYIIEGNAENFCMGVGGPTDPYWTFETPVCIAEFTCPFRNIPHGRIYTSNEQRYGSEITLVCDAGYIQDPPLGTILSKPQCRPNGLWEPPIPKCITPMCLLPESEGLVVTVPDYLIQDGDRVESSTIAEFRCQEEYWIYGDKQAECLVSTKWNKPLPFCIKKISERKMNWILVAILAVGSVILLDGLIRLTHGIYLMCKGALKCCEICAIFCLLLLPFYGTYKLIFFVRNLVTFNYQNTKDMAVTLYDDSVRDGTTIKLKYKPVHFSSNTYQKHIHRAFIPKQVAKAAQRKIDSCGAIVQLDTELGIRVFLGYVISETTAYSFVIERPPDRSEQTPLFYSIFVKKHPRKSDKKKGMFKCRVSCDDEINMKKVKEWLEDGEREQGKYPWKWTQLYTRKHYISSYLSHWRPTSEIAPVDV